MAIGQNLAASLTGNAVKAILYVRNAKVLQKEDDRTKEVVGWFPEDQQSAALKELKASYKKSGAAYAASISSKFVQAGQSGNIPSFEEAKKLSSEYVAMEVQYNPSSLRLLTTTGKQVNYGNSMGDMASGQVTEIIQPNATVLSCQLVFDDMNVYDAFMMSNLSPSIGNVVSGAADMTKKVKAMKEMKAKKAMKNGDEDIADASTFAYSVRPQVEALLGLMVNQRTRYVNFCWSHMGFAGEMTDVVAKYTMFNKDGEPIRATVDIQIRQSGDYFNDIPPDERAGEDAGSTFYWDMAYHKLFGDDGYSTKSGGKSTASKIMNNNVLGLNL